MLKIERLAVGMGQANCYIIYDEMKALIVDPGAVDFFEGEAYDPEVAEAEQWIQAIIHDTEPVVKPREALIVTEILEAIYQSAKTGQPVILNQ